MIPMAEAAASAIVECVASYGGLGERVLETGVRVTN